jgi:hypothetical protein
VIDAATRAEWRKQQGEGMTSALGEYTPEEFWQLLDAYEELLADKVGGPITIERIKGSEAERARIKSELVKIGRGIYEIREGNSLNSDFRLSDYSFSTFDGTHYAGQDETDWPMGTPTISISFYNSGWGEVRSVTFPSAWIEADWRQLETDRVAVEKAEQARQEEEKSAARQIAHEENERKTYERLRAKFEKEPEQ